MNLKLEGFSLIKDKQKIAEKIMIEKLIEKTKVPAIPSTHKMKTCTVENETFR